MKVNCGYCGVEIDRHKHQHPAKFCCFECKREKNRLRTRRSMHKK